ncbi:hypothetical protein I316_05205 [Kwoniella heveanensis BCC8398]|uniref:Uncharacterized protein n=1 Tax=Kwoniella heveanensis BCC8398 TaxID=1296120 RepID=A0A1B9GQ18_9TREE|nr:hypothetical protein I316_05205 [Kwoniella heveanensis BCC8398]
MATIIDDENVNFAWIGTSCHSSTKDGLYGVSVDNGDIQYFSGYALTGEFQATLFATNGLEQGTHHLKISNENARNIEQYPDYIWLDIDSVAVTGNLISGSSVQVDDAPASSSAVSSSTAPSSAVSGGSSTASDSFSSASGSSSSASGDPSTSTEPDVVVSGQYSTSGTVNIISTATDDPISTESAGPTLTRPSASNSVNTSESASSDGGNTDNHKWVPTAIQFNELRL